MHRYWCGKGWFVAPVFTVVPEIVVDDVLVVMCDPAATLSVVEASDAEATVVKDSVHVRYRMYLNLGCLETAAETVFEQRQWLDDVDAFRRHLVPLLAIDQG